MESVSWLHATGEHLDENRHVEMYDIGGCSSLGIE